MISGRRSDISPIADLIRPIDRTLGEVPGAPVHARRTTLLAALASYIDAGSIVAGAAGLAVWQDEFAIGSGTVGLIAAFSSNAISAGVGALVGGWLADRAGRKTVYQWDMLLYAAGVLWIIFATQPWMLLAGYVLTGLAVGADVPASWTLIAELAPAARRGRDSATAQMLWGVGPAVVLLLALGLSGLGALGIRIIFLHLLAVALVLWSLRRRVDESSLWTRSRASPLPPRALLRSRHLPALLFLTGIYGIWNLKAGTGGFFMPYLLRTVGGQSQAASVAIQLLGGLIGLLGVWLVFMRHVDRTSQRGMFGVAVALQLVGVLLLALSPLTTAVALGYVVLTGFGAGFGPQAFFQLWSAESFPTMLRSTAVGVMFAIVRIGLGIWSLFVPALATAGFDTLAWLLAAFLVTSGTLGLIFAPANAGKSLEDLHAPIPAGATPR